jgi:hypothetical protein
MFMAKSMIISLVPQRRNCQPSGSRHMLMRSLLAGIILASGFSVQAQISVSFLESTQISTEGLYFEGEKGVNYKFGKRITPHGDCIDVVNGYVFVTWYKGGMDKRNLMVSRKKVDGGQWKTIEFPDQHIGFRGNPTIGDSHNTAAITVCPIDGTVHLIYDMHAYSKTDFPNNYFNYRVSAKDGAFVPDEQWTLANFGPKRHFLKEGINYERSTYPGFLRFDDGRIMVELRFGGSGNGNDVLAIYDGKNWSENMQYNNGNQSGDGKYSIYGGYQYLHGKLIAGYSIRYATANTGTHPLYQLNNGFYYSEAKSPYQVNDWTDIQGNSISLPVQDPDFLKLAEPCDIGIGNRIAISPVWTVTKSGAIHFITTVSGKNVHFYKPSGTYKFSHSLSTPGPDGDLFSFGSQVLVVALENERPIVKVTNEGENNWQTIYQETTGDRYRHCNVRIEGDRLFIYAMKTGSGDAQPITLLSYSLKKVVSGSNLLPGYKKQNVYPNPVTDWLQITNIKSGTTIELFDLLGRKRLEHYCLQDTEVKVLDLALLEKGIYLLKTDGQKFEKLVKK